jgi:hypothetical protein
MTAEPGQFDIRLNLPERDASTLERRRTVSRPDEF